MFDLVFEIFPFLVVFFVVDGLCFVREHQVLFASPVGGFFLRRGPGLHLLGLVPTAELVVLGGPPVLVDAVGLHWLPSPRHRRAPGTWASVAHESIRAVAVRGAFLVIDAERHHEIACASRARARILRRDLESVRALAPNARARLLESLSQEASDTLALRALREELRPAARWFRGLGVLLFVLLFLAVPACLYAPEQRLAPGLTFVVSLVLLVHLVLVTLAFRQLRRDGLGTRAVLEALAPILLFPPGAVRTLSLVSGERYARFSPATAAAAWLTGSPLLRLARREHFRLTRELEEATERESLHRRREIDHWVRALATAGIDLHRIPGPTPRDATAAAYCPLCDAEYRPHFEVCSDCGVALSPFDSRPSS
jgi:hypothetical protein